jgi:hypothetical protein
MDSLLDNHQRDLPTPQTTDSHELRFWIAVDPLLADLHKQLVDAKSHRARVCARHGEDDAMTDIANDMADSAQCRVDTRLIELRRNEEAKAMVAALMRKAAVARQEESIEAVRQRNNAFWKDFAAPQPHRIRKQATDAFWLMAISVLALRQSLQDANQKLSIAMTFSRATANDDLSFKRTLAGSA